MLDAVCRRCWLKYFCHSLQQVPIVIMKTKDMRNSTNIFLTNLSIADLLVLLICTPTVLVEVNSKPETWVLGQEMCKLRLLVFDFHDITIGVVKARSDQGTFIHK